MATVIVKYSAAAATATELGKAQTPLASICCGPVRQIHNSNLLWLSYGRSAKNLSKWSFCLRQLYTAQETVETCEKRLLYKAWIATRLAGR